MIAMAFSYVNATEIKTANMTMKFSSDGKPKSLTFWTILTESKNNNFVGTP